MGAERGGDVLGTQHSREFPQTRASHEYLYRNASEGSAIVSRAGRPEGLPDGTQANEDVVPRPAAHTPNAVSDQACVAVGRRDGQAGSGIAALKVPVGGGHSTPVASAPCGSCPARCRTGMVTVQTVSSCVPDIWKSAPPVLRCHRGEARGSHALVLK